MASIPQRLKTATLSASMRGLSTSLTASAKAAIWRRRVFSLATASKAAVSSSSRARSKVQGAEFQSGGQNDGPVAGHSERRDCDVPTVPLIQTLACPNSRNRPLIRVQLERFENSLGGVPLPPEMQDFLRLVRGFVCTISPEPELYGLRQGFVDLKRTAGSILPCPLATPAIEVWVVHSATSYKEADSFRIKINLLERARRQNALEENKCLLK